MSGGRPRKLTPDQERHVYDVITATHRGERIFRCAELARELGVGVSTVQRILTQQRRAHLGRIVAMFRKEPQNSIQETNP